MNCDPSQQLVLDLDPREHATVLGAAGTGKSQLVTELLAAEAERPRPTQPLAVAGSGASLALIHSRRAGVKLRRRVEQRVTAPLTGSVVRTPVSLAFWIAAQFAAAQGTPAPRLLTGVQQDEALQAAFTEVDPGVFDRALRDSVTFRAELRNLWRVCDDYDLDVTALAEVADASGDTDLGELPTQWRAAARVLHAAARVHAAEPVFSASGIIRHARALLATADDAELRFLPSRLLVDDAQDITEGGVGLVAACAARGTAVWGFGDPDLGTSSFQGERTEFVSSVTRAMNRKLGREMLAEAPRVVLARCYRGGEPHRQLAATLSAAIGAAGAGEQRRAYTAAAGDAAGSLPTIIEAARLRHRSEQVGALAHRLREAHYGTGDRRLRLNWSDMAVVCRSRAEAETLTRELTLKQVPAQLVGGGTVLWEHRIVRDLIELVEHVLTGRALDADTLSAVATGPLGALDQIALRRLRGQLLLTERRAAAAAGREARPVDVLLAEHAADPGSAPLVDSAAGRRLRRIALSVDRARRAHRNGASAREIVWRLWDDAELAAHLQRTALSADSQALRADANRTLDAVLALMFALERAEIGGVTPAEVIAEIRTSEVPEDTLAASARLDAVVVATPQGLVGREYDLVCVTELQDGVWPNLKPRGSFLGLTALERLLRGERYLLTERRDTLHDELRLLLQAVTRTRRELFVTALHTAEDVPSSFWQYFADHEVDRVPTSGFTLRDTVASLRRALETNPDHPDAARQLAVLAHHGVPGARPDQWYGVAPVTTSEPLLARDPGAPVRIRPSSLAAAETCPLSWALNTLAGPTLPTVSSGLGTLLHAAFERAVARDTTAEDLHRFVLQHWQKLPLAAGWEAQRQEQLARHMSDAIVTYVDRARGTGWRPVASELGFAFELGGARMSGKIDRLEAREVAGTVSVRVVDLKTGKHAVSAAEAEADAQLLAYQYALRAGELVLDPARPGPAASDPPPELDRVTPVGAQLVYVHPTHATSRAHYKIREQAPMDDTAVRDFTQRLETAAQALGGSTFTAHLEHHCEDGQAGPSICAIHIIPAVSAL